MVTFGSFEDSSAGQFENDEHDTDEEMKNGNDDKSETSDDDDADAMNDYNISLQHFTQGFDRICKNNANLKKRVTDMKKNHQLKVKNLKETTTKLMNENMQLKLEMKNQIKTLKEAHDQEMAKLKEEHRRLIEQQKLSRMEQCK